VPEDRITFCRVCEPACGLVASVEDGELVRLRPDRNHPITRGFACNKGLAGIDIHRDPDRLNQPLRRDAGGELAPTAWDEVLPEIAGRLRGIVDRHGSGAVSGYIGNPSAFNALLGPASGAFFAQLGVHRMFSSGTQDCANKFAGSEAVFGSSTMHPIPDLANTDYLLIFGENPRVSHMSFMAIADPMSELKSARKRGATIRFINPRHIESAGPDTGDVVLIRPDTDLYLLAAMLCEIDRTIGFAADAVESHGKHVEELRAFVGRYPPERVAGITGIDAEQIRTLAREFAEAPRASVHASTGLNMGRQGTLAYWLVQMLSFLTGNLDREGGNVLSEGFYLSAKAGRRRFADGFRESPFGPLRKGTLPGNLLAEHIEDPDDPVRALFIIAGNPLLSIGGEERLRKAFEQLELIVVIDLYRNASGEYAHYLLPATDMFEREDVNLTGLGLQHRPYIQYTERVVEPRFERREEWWILGRLCQELGFKSPLDHDAPQLWGRIDHMLRSRGHSLDEVRSSTYGLDFGPHQPGRFFEEHLQTDDGRVDCCPAAFEGALQQAELEFRELDAEPANQLKLITKRDPYMHNSWYANVPVMKRGERDRNYLFMHPDDARARELSEGDVVRAHNAHGSVEIELKLADDLKPGVVAVTHGWGNARTPGMRFAQQTAGANPNRLLPSGPGSFDALSSQSHMTGIPIEVTPR
jgi:anaerobic selenocysteine-containing dehydrogenase